jgi:hypothetical protein
MNIQSNTPATALRQRMIEDMVGRNLGRRDQDRRDSIVSIGRHRSALPGARPGRTDSP